MISFWTEPARQHLNRKPIEDRSPMGCVEPPSSQLSLLVAATMSAKVEMESRKADVAAAAAVMAGTVTTTGTAAMRSGAVAIHGMPVTIIAGDSAFTIDRTAAGAAVVRVAAAGVPAVVAVVSLQNRGHEQSEAGGSCHEGDNLFHNELSWGLSRRRKGAACKSDERPQHLFNSTAFLYEHRRPSPH